MCDQASTQDQRSDEEREFVRQLVERGEAAKPDAEGRLPAGATHEIVQDDAGDGAPRVERRRFSII
jgi:hypothetical protein